MKHQTRWNKHKQNLLILTRGETVVEAENYMNLEMTKIQEWAQNNKLKFHKNK
jgi:hypothetical protein